MQELAIVLGFAGIGVLIIRGFDKWNVTRGQTQLQDKVTESDKTQARLEGQQEQEDKETKRKVDEITKEQNDKPTRGNLADWFNRRK